MTRLKYDRQLLGDTEKLSSKSSQAKGLEKRLEHLLADNELLRNRVVELDQKLSVERARAEDSFELERLRELHELQIRDLKKRSRQMEANYREELERREVEYDARLQKLARKLREKESELTHLRRLGICDYSVSKDTANEGSKSADRTPSPGNFRRLLNPGSKKDGSRRREASPKRSAGRVSSQLMKQIAKEHVELRHDNTLLSNKLKKIEKTLGDIERSPHRPDASEEEPEFSNRRAMGWLGREAGGGGPSPGLAARLTSTRPSQSSSPLNRKPFLYLAMPSLRITAKGGPTNTLKLLGKSPK